MMALRLVQLIEAKSEQLAEGLLDRYQHSARCSDLRKVPEDELRQRAYEIYRNLNDWLSRATEHDIEKRYVELGRRRHSQGVRLSHYIWAIILTKEHLETFLEGEGFINTAVDLYGHVTVYRQLDRFFERAISYAAEGYEDAQRRKHRVTAA